jgi:endonuclease-3
MHTAARLVMRDFDGDLRKVLAQPPQKAKKALMKFPMIGEPGAEKILMFLGAVPVLALESNGVRVLQRIGFGQEGKNYAATYRSIREAVAGLIPDETPVLIAAHLLLKRHGQERCFRNGPVCRGCPVAKDCQSANMVS